jgi:hypothetical protein
MTSVNLPIDTDSTTLAGSTGRAATRRRPGIRGAVAWIAAGAAVAASAALALVVLDDDATTTVPAHLFSVERGSIAALDHQADALARRAGTPAALAAERGSITALDHRVAVAGPAEDEHQDRIDAAACLRLSQGLAACGPVTAAATPSDASAERGSIAALDHEASDEAP